MLITYGNDMLWMLQTNAYPLKWLIVTLFTILIVLTQLSCHRSFLSRFLLSQMFVRFIYSLEFWGSKSNICTPTSVYQEVFRHRNFQGRFGVVFSFYGSYWQLLGQWSTGLNLAKDRNTKNHLGTEGVLRLKFLPHFMYIVESHTMSFNDF